MDELNVIMENIESEVKEEDDFINIRKTYLKKKFASKKTELYEVDSLQFSIFSSEDILKLSETRICNKELYFPMTQNPMPFGVLDDRLGASKGRGVCKTCGKSFQDCCGHWGHVTLHQPVLHVGYFKHLINLLYCVCKTCSRLLLSEEDKKKFLLRSRRCHDAMQRKILLKTLVIKCKRENFCLHPDCRAPQGVLRRVMKPSLDQFMKIVLQKKVRKDGAGSAASRTSVINEDLDPSYIRQLLKRMSAVDCTILDVHLPEKLIISSLLVPPKCIRPSITLGDSGTNEDDLTIVFSEIIDTNNILKAQSQAGVNCPSVLGNWELLQLQCTRFINSEALAVQPLLASKNISFNGRGICQRLKGKEGRFRGNLSGKRVDFSGRTVISPDANCPIPEVIIPMWSAKRLTFPERVCELTIEKLRAAVLRGAEEWPGALFVIKKDAGKTSLHFGNRRQIANNLQYGDIVERHLWDGDIVLFNRQPSLHRLSIMAHRARVMPWRTFRFNECVCTPYNADFDGDEMNCHLPQTQEARAEALHLMGVVQNLVTPKNGEPLVAATQDFLSGSYLLTSRDTFMTRDVFCQCCCHFTNAKMHIDLTPPTILKPIELWTGKQLFNTMLRPNKSSCNVIVNFELRERDFTEPSDGLLDLMCPNEGYVIFDDSELLCGAVAKMTLGNGSKKGLIYNLIRDNSSYLASAFLGRLATLIGRWFSNYGMTIGIDDVTPNSKVSKAKSMLLEKGYQDVEKEVALFKQGRLQPNPGCTLEETLEIRVKSILDELRSIAGKVANQNLSSTNKPLIMFLSGAKGALINIAQMIALVGQQNVGGQRIQNGFVERTLPHFDHKCQSAKSRGFVAHSFYDGLDPDEFFFHTMSGREGLVDTAVKTAETGYMQRRLVKALEDLSVCYDRTVRTSDGQIVQFVYGDDGLNPTVMERKNCSIPLDKIFHNMASLVYKVNYRTLSAYAEKKNETFFSNEINEGYILNDCRSPMHSDNLLNIDTMQQVSKSIAPFCILPPTEKEIIDIEKRIQYHIKETQKFLEAANNKTKNFTLGKDSLTTNIATDVKLKTGTKRQRLPLLDNEGICQIPPPNKRVQLVKKSNATINDSNSYPQNFIFQKTQKVPRLLQQKLMVMESWRNASCHRYGSLEGLAKLEKDKCYIQAKWNVEAHVVVNEWLNVLKQNVPLLPFEILKWADYLLDRTSEMLPEALREHQNICTNESETHQDNTDLVKTFRQELQSWITEKVRGIVQYRCDNFLEPGDTLKSYCKAIAKLQDDLSNNESCLPLKYKTISNTGNDCLVSRYLCSVYPKNYFLRRLWVIPCKLTNSESSGIKKEKTDSDELLPLVKQEIVDNCENGSYRWKYNRNFWITPKHLLEFFRLAWRRYNRALIEPGEAVGAIGAQSIGEPGTQMTLKTFHFAGVASMNVTLGVPRIKEILNASTKIATPIIQVVLQEDKSFDYAAMVKGRIEKTVLRDVCSSLKQVFSPEGAYLAIRIDKKTIARHFLDITTTSIREKILTTIGLSGARERLKEENVVVISDCKLQIHLPMTLSFFFDIQLLKERIQNVRLCGLENIKRGVIKQEKKIDTLDDCKTPLYTYSLAVEGYGLREVMGISGVVGTKCTSNHVMEVRQILGIEAARFVIIDEIRNCMEAYSMDIDCRHMQLLGDVMTFRGDVLGISRFGIQKIRASTLMLASFEETNEHLFEAAAHNREDKIRGVSECIIMGKSIGLGTGSFDLLYNYTHHLTQSISQSHSFHQSTNNFLNSCSSVSTRAALLLSKYTKLTTPSSPSVIS